MKKTNLAITITTIAGIIPVIVMKIVDHEQYKWVSMAFLIGFIVILMLIAAFFLSLLSKTKEYARGVLMSAGFVLPVSYTHLTLPTKRIV